MYKIGHVIFFFFYTDCQMFFHLDFTFWRTWSSGFTQHWGNSSAGIFKKKDDKWIL